MKEKTIEINGVPFTYMDEVGDPYSGFNKMKPADAEKILKLSSKLLKDCGIDFFIAFGTLLGAIREGYFIKGDGDVDIVVTDEKKLYESLPYFQKNGLMINRIFPGDLFSFHTEGRLGHIDMYIMHPIEGFAIWKPWCTSICGHAVPKKYFQKITIGEYTLGGEQYPYPENPIAVLEWWYGKNWRIPQSKAARQNIFLRWLWLLPSNLWRRFKKKMKKIFKRNV